jgi:hypothetical protein
MCELVRPKALGSKQVSGSVAIYAAVHLVKVTFYAQDFKENFADPIRVGMMTDATQAQVMY